MSTPRVSCWINSYNVCGKNDVGNSRFSGVTSGMSGDRAPTFRGRFDGFFGTVGEMGERLSDGDAGRLLNVSILGMGVLDGRGATSMESAGNAFIGETGMMGDCDSCGGRAGDRPLL